MHLSLLPLCTPNVSPSCLQFNAVREATIRMLQARHKLDVHSQALSHLHGGYHATGETTNFKAELANNAEQLEESNP